MGRGEVTERRGCGWYPRTSHAALAAVAGVAWDARCVSSIRHRLLDVYRRAEQTAFTAVGLAGRGKTRQGGWTLLVLY